MKRGVLIRIILCVLTATVVGFIVLRAMQNESGATNATFFGQFSFHKAGTVVLFIVVVVALMDFASAKLREKLV